MPRFVAVLVLAFSFVVQAESPADSIEDLIDSELSSSGAPGLSYAVVADGEITAAAVHGVANAGSDSELTPETPFVIGSITKSFTALAIMQLVEASEVELVAQLSVYLDEFVGQPAGSITIRQLLGHTSGFSTLQGNAAHTDATDTKNDLERHVAGLAEVEPDYQPGERWAYSNTNYQILGRVIEVVSGQDYQGYVTANILEPVGMEHSFVADGEVHESMATGHTPWFGTKRPLAGNTTDRLTAPQGGIIATNLDLALYMNMMMNGQDDVLSADGKAQMMRPASSTSPWYGFGWYLDADNGSVWHAGSSPGVETLLTMIPDQQRGAVALTNAGSGMGFGETTQLLNGITALGTGLEYAGEGSQWPRKALFVSLVLLPVFYLLSIAWAWRHRAAIRAKSGPAGLFSWWFPLLSTLASAWVLLWLVPRLFSAPLSTIGLFSPDLHLTLVASAVCGVAWALFRLGVAYTGPAAATSSPEDFRILGRVQAFERGRDIGRVGSESEVEVVEGIRR